MILGVLQMIPLALLPLAIGKAIDEGIAPRDFHGLLTWIAVILVLGVMSAVSTLMATRAGDKLWLACAGLTQRTVMRHATSLGADLPRQIKSGEIVAVGAADIYSIASLMETIGRLTASIVSFVLVAVIVVGQSPVLGVAVLVGIPIATLGFTPLLRPLQLRLEAHREQVGEATAVAADIVSGLRILRGIGGERQFHGHFVAASQRVRGAGVAASRVDAGLSALGVLLPGLVVALVTWLAARLAVDGEISIGELVAVYGVSAFLSLPVSVAGEAVRSFNASRVPAGRACTILNLKPTLSSPGKPVPLPKAPFGLLDQVTGITCPAGQLTVISGSPEVADRLGRYVDAPVFADDVPLRDGDLEEIRRRILVSHNLDTLFSGRLADEIDMGAGIDLTTALWTADAMDIVDSLEHGIDEHLVERGRTLSGGQRQRMTLARALSFDADVLVLDEPTSAVDAHTEARIVARVSELRRGRTTIVLSRSPLWHGAADKVYAR